MNRAPKPPVARRAPRGRRRRGRTNRRTCTSPARRPTSTTCPSSPARCTRRSACRRWRTAGCVAIDLDRDRARARRRRRAHRRRHPRRRTTAARSSTTTRSSPRARSTTSASRCSRWSRRRATRRGAPRRRPRRRCGSSRCRRSSRRRRRTPRSSYVLPPMHLARGDAARRHRRAPHRLAGTLRRRRPGAVLPRRPDLLRRAAGGRRHARPLLDAAPERDAAPGRAMRWACASHHVQVECRRMGGGFGGKESQSALFACVAAIAARRLAPAGQAAPRPRRRLPDHRPAPLLPLRVRGRLRRRRPHPRRRARRWSRAPASRPTCRAR